MTELDIISLNISEEKGTIKLAVPEIVLDEYGVKGDAHAGPWHRQVSLLGMESIQRFSGQAGRIIHPGEFAENITTLGLELGQVRPLDRFISGEVELEVTQLGKKCHGDQCSIFREVGNCVMPKEGIFCRVIGGGMLQTGNKLTYYPKTYKGLVITLSDRASRGEYEDKSGPALEKALQVFFEENGSPYQVIRQLIPDQAGMLKYLVTEAVQKEYDLIFTTGGTGIGPHDITPEVIKPMLDKEIPGIMEHIRLKYGSTKPNALLTRGIAGLIGNSLIFTLPGSVTAVNEYMEEILHSLKHMIYMLHGLDLHRG